MQRLELLHSPASAALRSNFGSKICFDRCDKFGPAHSSTTVSLATTRSMGVSWTSGGMLQAGLRAGSIGAEVAGRVRGRWHCSGAGLGGAIRVGEAPRAARATGS